MGYRYSLAQVQVSISKLPGRDTPVYFGGQGSMIGNITVARNTERFSAEGDATGGYVINETLDPTGTTTISIKQFAPLVATLTDLFNAYSDYKYNDNQLATEQGSTGVDINVYYQGKLVACCHDCYLNMPELPLEEENGSRDFPFVCGEVHFEKLK